MNKKTLNDINVAGKRVLMRVDFNVPLKEGVVNDDTRIVAALPSIQHVLDQGASVVLMSHLGRPKGEKKPEFSLSPIVPVLAEKLGRDVKFSTDCIGEETEALSAALQPGEVLLLENVRYYAAEEGKGVSDEEQDAFAKQLAAHGDVYVSDAFGTAHRAHASMVGVTKYFEDCVSGFLLQKEIDYLGKAVESPERPFVAIIGGAKISGKIDVVINLMDKVDALIIGGGMAYTFFKSQGQAIGGSICEDDKLDLAQQILADAEAKGVKLLLPVFF